MALLESGTTREEVFNGFVGSKEFAGICQGYGIVHGGGVAVPQYGTIPAGPCSVCGREAGVTAFVTRLYDCLLYTSATKTMKKPRPCSPASRMR